MSVTWPRGFRAAGIAAGIKGNGKPDLALVKCDGEAVAAGVATTNRFKAASVVLSSRNLRSGRAGAVLLNSGNANAINGREGMDMTRRIIARAGSCLGLEAGRVVFLSTGKIGLLLPEEKLVSALPRLVGELGEDGHRAAEAILTTDRRTKEAALETEIEGPHGKVRIGGMAKGSGMIRPEMATMLCVLTTDAVIGPEALGAALREAVGGSFNMLSVDEDQSTNDFTVVLASGRARNRRIAPGSFEFNHFTECLGEVCRRLARAMALDGEGADKLMVVRVSRAWSARDARRVARAITGSNLVKSMLTGNSPNWGRILAAAGSCAARIRPEKTSLDICGHRVFENGEVTRFDEKAVSRAMAGEEVSIEIDLGLGSFTAEAYGCNLTEEYVTVNREYS